MHFSIWGSSLMGLPVLTLLFPNQVEKWRVSMYWWLLLSFVTCVELSIMFDPGVLEFVGGGTACLLYNFCVCASVGIRRWDSALESRLDREALKGCSIILVFMVLGAYTCGIPHHVVRSDFSHDLFKLVFSSFEVGHVFFLYIMAFCSVSFEKIAAAFGHASAVLGGGVPFISNFGVFLTICWREMSELVGPSTGGWISVSQHKAIAFVRASVGVYLLFLLHIVHVSEVNVSWPWWTFVPFHVCALSHLLLSAAHAFAAAQKASGERHGAII